MISLFFLFSLSCFQNVICICSLLWKCSAQERPIQLVILSCFLFLSPLSLFYKCDVKCKILPRLTTSSTWAAARATSALSRSRSFSSCSMCSSFSFSAFYRMAVQEEREESLCYYKSLQTQAFIKIVTTCEITSNI